MTQALIANMLGVRREGVTEAAGKLQQLGVIEYRSGAYHRARPAEARDAVVRVLRRGQKETNRLLSPHADG